MSIFYFSRIVPLLGVSASTFLGGCANAQQSTPKTQALLQSLSPVISQISLSDLIKEAGGTSSIISSNGINGVFGILNQLPERHIGCQGLSIAIYPTASIAQRRFKDGTSRRSYVTSSPIPKIADDFLPIILSEKRRRAIGEIGDVRSGGVVYMRKTNVLLSFSWRGDASGALSYARKIELALANPKIVTMVPALSLPTITLSPPESVELRGTAVIPYQTQNDVVVSAMQESFPRWGTSGKVSFSSGTLGKQKAEFDFLTQDHRVIPVSLDINVVPQTPAQPSTWAWPLSRLYFKPIERHLQSRYDNSEWIELNPSTFERVANQERVAQVENVLGTLLQKKWRAPKVAIQVFNDHSTPTPARVFFCTYKVGSFNVVCWGNLTGRFWLYMDGPAGTTKMPQLATVINWNEIKKRNAEKNFLAAPGAELTSQSFTRLRALQVSGPWKPVNVVLARILFPEHIDIPFVGQQF